MKMPNALCRSLKALALVAALALAGLAGALAAGPGGPTNGDISDSAQSPGVRFVLENPVKVQGLNCDAMTIDRQGNLYLASPRFMATFADCVAEGSAHLQENHQIVVQLTKQVETSRPSGTVNGPQITFVVDYETGELISSEVIEMEGNTILMPESEQKKWGQVFAAFIRTAQMMEKSMAESHFAFAQEELPSA